jgi:putative membrane protein
MQLAHRSVISAALVWVFHIAAVVGCALGFCDWFTEKTPLNLLLIASIVALDHPPREIFRMAIPFAIGMIAEWIGVHTGWLFGDYSYGNNLGWKIWEVPMLIGMNWLILIYAGSAITAKTGWNNTFRAISTAGLITSLDFLIEQVAPQLHFWSFKNGEVPFSNYAGWLIVSFIASYLYILTGKENRSPFLGIHIFFAILFYFVSINILMY